MGYLGWSDGLLARAYGLQPIAMMILADGKVNFPLAYR